MDKIFSADWIKSSKDYGDICPVFKKTFKIKKNISHVKLYITAFGVYQAKINGQTVGDYILAPGWTAYDKRLQYQEYDITELISDKNEITVTIGKGWCVGRLGWDVDTKGWSKEVALLAALEIEYQDGTVESIVTDENWQTSKSPILFSELYDGEIYDASEKMDQWEDSVIANYSKDILIPQEGEIIKEIEEIEPVELLITPKGERVIDFGQIMTGYVSFKVRGNQGDIVELSHAEILDKDGNFYTENLRSADQKIKYISGGGEETYKPHHTFQGFRYIRLDSWPTNLQLDDFRGIVVHSEMKRTGSFECSSPLLNKLYKNIIWGQKGNFLDIPTDCPQRDERLGWTGDAQAFIRAASYNFDVERFFQKWLRDLEAEQFDDGGIPHVIPNILKEQGNSAAWGDAAVICPWQIYLTYGNKDILKEQYDSMQQWINYIRKQGENEYLWNTGTHFGDWLGLDAPEGSYKGSTDEHLIATAFYAYSTSLLIKAGKVLEKDMSEYEDLYKNIVLAFRDQYLIDGRLSCNTQTAHVLALYFQLVENKEQIAQSLANLIQENSNKLATGFVGTPYLLHVLSDHGFADLAYTLLLREDYPSWLYPVKKGATTVWEHWDGVKPDGTMWSPDMNSFNHYAYGAVADWMYGVMAGIKTDEDKPGFKHIIFKPIVDKRIDYVRGSIETEYGIVSSQWERQDEKVFYKFEVPESCTATILIDEKEYEVSEGKHQYKS